MKVKSHKHAKTYSEAAIHVVAEELKKVPESAELVKQAWAISGGTYKKALDLANSNGNLKEIEDLINLANQQADEAREITGESLISTPTKDIEDTVKSKNLMLYAGIGAIGLAGILMIGMLIKRGRKKVAVAANTDDKVLKRMKKLLRKFGSPLCNCGGPEYGTEHAPDCEYVTGLEQIRDIAKGDIDEEELKEQEELERRISRSLERMR